MEAPCFWGSHRVILQGPDGWRVVSWPDLAELARGEGKAAAEPNGDRIVSWRPDGPLLRRDCDGERAISFPVEATPIRFVAWGQRNELLAVVGRNALNPPFSQGPSLLPIPSSGATGQRFGTYPTEGMSVWCVPLDDEPRRRFTADGIEQIDRPFPLADGRVGYQFYRFPTYGGTVVQRIHCCRSDGGGASADLFPDLAGATTAPSASPKGDLAFLHSDLELAFPFWYRLVLRAAAPGAPLRYPLPEDLRLSGYPPVWSPDGCFVAVTAFEGIRVGVVVVDVGSDTWRWLGPVDGFYSDVALAPGGKTALAGWESPASPKRLVRVEAESRVALEEDLSPSKQSESSQPAPDYRLIRWRHEGFSFEGVLAMPNGTGPWPLVVDLHGGPVNGLRFGQQPNLARWCAAGFAAFAPEYRGSGIAGKEAMVAAFRAEDDPPGRSEVGDVLVGVAELLRDGPIDPTRLYLFGHSAGANLVNRVLTFDHRFRAAVAWEGHADPWLAFGLAAGGGGLAFARTMLGGNPWDAPERYRGLSALAQVAAVRTPLLLLAGDHDGAVWPAADTLIWYTALREHGVDCELVFYRGEGHLMRRPENQDDLFARSIAWFNAHGGSSR